MKVEFETLLADFACSCGKVHSSEVEKIVMYPGALPELPAVIREMGDYKHMIMICDDNTYAVAGTRVEKMINCDQVIKLNPHHLHANERAVGEVQEKLLKVDEILLDDERHQVFVSDQPCELTFKEYELLRLLMQNRGIVLSRDVIMDRIWDMNCDVESRTLDVHLKTLRAKLGESARHIKTIRNVGYRME